MKKLSLFFLILITSALTAQGIDFDKSKFKKLLDKAKKENKLIFVDAYTSWCGPCKLMAKNVFTNKEVGDYYNANFINAKINMEKGEGPGIAKKYRVFSYPTYLFINGDGEVVSKNRGYVKAPQFIIIGQEAQEAFKGGDNLKSQFEKGVKTPDTLKKIIKMFHSSDYNLAKKASERYFTNKKGEFTAEDINLLIPFIRTKDGINFKYFTSHKAEIIKFLPEKNYNLVYKQILVSDIFIRHSDEKTGVLDDEKSTLNELIDIVGKEDAENIFKRYQLSTYQNTNIKKFIQVALDYYKDKNNFNPKEIMQTSWIIAENSKDKETLTIACQWMETLVMRQETSESTFILAKLYHLLGKNTEAKMFAKASIQLSKGKQMLLAEQLLKKIK